jgi:hypothetical protein
MAALTGVFWVLINAAVLLYPTGVMAGGKTASLPFEDSRVRIWWTSPLEKIGLNYSARGSAAEQKGNIQLQAAKNEYESFQIIISNKDSKSINVQNIGLSDFESSDKSGKIGKDNIEAFYIGYVNGEFPDVLFPANVAKYREEFKEIANGENRDLWFTIYVPPDTKAGDYVSSIEIQANDETFVIPVQIRVWNFELPKQTHVKSDIFQLGQEDIVDRYHLDPMSDKYEQMVTDIYEQYRRHRISPGYATPVHIRTYFQAKKDPEALGKYWEKWCGFWIGNGLECNSILPKNFGFAAEKPIYESIKQHGWQDHVHMYLPNDEAKEGEKAEMNVAFAKKAREAFPGIKLLHTFGGLEAGLAKKHIDYYTGAVDIWCLVPGAYLNGSGIKEALDERVKEGGEISWYIHRNLGVAQSGLELRQFFWNMWSHNISRMTLWKTTFWTRPPLSKEVAGVKVQRVPEKKTFREKRGFQSTRSSGVGPGTLFWPDEDRVLTSIRLEIIRDGIEDYEYFVLARNKNIRPDTGAGAMDNMLSTRKSFGERLENSK